jgi:hypothetical protein
VNGADQAARRASREPVSVSAWGELPGHRKLPGVLQILVGGQHAGAIERDGDVWRASWQARVSSRITQTEHQTAVDALTAVLRSGFARRLGARKTSRVSWSQTASRLVAAAYRDDAR